MTYPESPITSVGNSERQKACSNSYTHAQSVGLLSAQQEQYEVGVSILIPTNTPAFYTSFYFKQTILLTNNLISANYIQPSLISTAQKI